MRSKKIVILGGQGQSTNIVFHALNGKFNIDTVIVEGKESLKIFLKRRIKKLGLFTVLGQIAFQMIIAKSLNFFSRKRISEIIKINNLNIEDIPAEKLKRVASVNANATIELLQSLNPDLVILNGTRIISKKVLQSIKCKFINTHVGITPMYRGVHGTYWALVNNDLVHSGVTVHFVDEGIDTGNVIKQEQVIPTKVDNFATYPLLQLSVGIELLVGAITNFFSENITITKEKGVSKLFYHPTIWTYVYYRIVKKIK